MKVEIDDLSKRTWQFTKVFTMAHTDFLWKAEQLQCLFRVSIHPGAANAVLSTAIDMTLSEKSYTPKTPREPKDQTGWFQSTSREPIKILEFHLLGCHFQGINQYNYTLSQYTYIHTYI